MIKSLFMTLLLILLSGCGENPTKPDIIKTNTVVVSIPNELITTCIVTQPPKIENYVLSNYLTKEDILVKYSINLLNDLTLCNNKIYAIQEWNTKQLSIYENTQE